MSRTDDDVKEHREQVGTAARAAAGAIRRMAVKLSSGSFWQAIGHLLLDGVTRETVGAEVFAGIGFHSRPHQSANAEVIIVYPGGAENPVIIGSRDEALRKSMCGSMGNNSAAMFNTKAIVIVNAGGTIEIRSKNGEALPIPTMDDYNNLASFVQAMTMPVSGSVAGPTLDVVPAATGTTVLKAE